METDKFEPNIKAQATRHSRVFLKSLFFSKLAFRFMLDSRIFLKRVRAAFSRGRYLTRAHFARPITVRDPFKKFIRQSLAAGIAILLISSFVPVRILDIGLIVDYFDRDTDFIEDGHELPPFMINEEGFILKFDEPAQEDYESPKFTDTLTHTVVSGDTCSTIAALYGINVSTLMWENGLSEECKLRVGVTLTVLPANGVNHVIAKGETMAAIVKKYGVEENKIREYNAGVEIAPGKKLFIPGGKKIEPVIVRSGVRSDGRDWSGNTFDTKIIMGSNAKPKSGKIFIWPANGQLTQGFRAGHYAYDIASASKPDVVA